MSDAVDNKPCIDIKLMNDGVYLVIRNVEINGEIKTISRKELLEIIEVYKIKNINFSVMNDIFNTDQLELTVKISDNIDILISNEEMQVEISADRLSAVARFTAPSKAGKLLTIEQIKSKITASGIRSGIIPETLAEIANSRKHGIEYLIAQGTPSVDGVDGRLEFLFDPSPKDKAPRILAGDKVDFKNLNMFETVAKDAPLVKIFKEQPGINGTDVFGRDLPSHTGKPAPPLPVGKNVYASSDGLILHAAVGGEVMYVNKRLSINPVYNVRGDVDFATGNINFNGSVIINGNILTGFSVTADGNIEVSGVVEGAKLKANGDIILCSGLQGLDRAEVTAGGEITAKFIEHALLIEAGGNITADSIIHSEVRCGGSLRLEGKSGLLVGGTTVVKQKINAKTIGSAMSTQTFVELGHEPEVLREYNALRDEYNTLREEYNSQGELVKELSAIKIEELSEERKMLLVRTMHAKKFNKEKLLMMQEKINELLLGLEADNGVLTVSNILRAGVKVTIGNAILFIRDDINCCTLSNVGGKVVVSY